MSLPPLREELSVQPGPRSHEGQPGWTLHDPTRNRFFRLDWLTAEILQRWSLGDARLICRGVAEQTPLHPGIDDVQAVLDFLVANQLLKLAGADNSAALARESRKRRQTGWRWLVHNYLFFRVPLVRPEKLLRWLDRYTGFLYSPFFWRLTIAVLLLGLVLVWRQWDVFTATWTSLANFEGLLGFLAVIVAVKIVHEFGHGLVATHFGCRVPTMGVAFLVLTPVAYTDTNEAWNLTERRPRLLIGAAGVLAELCLAAWATLAWALLPDGTLRSAAFILATTTWIKSVLINSSPVMRFDGYYLLSDYLDLPNLHTRCFALARWKLREWLFALGEPPPEYFRRRLASGLIALAIFIWIYRLIVFLGIAIFIYYFFFKALGIVLFAIEILWFILIPIFSEMKTWFAKRRQIVRSRRARLTALVALTVVVLSCVPLPQRVKLSAELLPQQEFKIVAPEAARLVALHALDGAPVTAGAPLLQLESHTLHYRLEKTKLRETRLEAEVAAAGVDASLRARLPILQAALATAQAGRREAEAALHKLAPTAPFDGTFRLADCDTRAGDWLTREETLATVIGPKPWRVSGYLAEEFTHLVAAGAQAKFYPHGSPNEAMALTVTTVERDAARTLSQAMLTTPFGGDVSARLVDDELIPERSLYRITLDVADVESARPQQIRRGTVVIDAGSEPLLARVWRSLLSLLWREAGF